MARLTALLFTTCAALLLHRSRERARMHARIRELDAALARARLHEHRTRIGPHLMLNALNSVAVLAEEAGAARVLDATGRLAGLMRSTLEQRAPFTSLRSEIDYLDHYLAVERVRFGDRLAVHWDVEEACLDAQVPALLLQPLVENAIRHGRTPRTGVADVTVGARREHEHLRIWVADCGPGLGANGRTGTGIGITRRQLELLFAGSYSLDISPGAGRGVIVTMQIPHLTNGSSRHDDPHVARG